MEVHPAGVAALNRYSSLRSLVLSDYHPPHDTAAFEEFASLPVLEDLIIAIAYPKVIKRFVNSPSWTTSMSACFALAA